MDTRFGAVGSVALAAAIATCGLFMLSGVGPSATNQVPLPAAAPASTDALPETTPSSTPDPTNPATTPPTTTTTTTTTTTAPVAPSTTVPEPDPTPVPLSVNASGTVVGAGGNVTFEGTCANGENGPLGPVIVWIIGDSSDAVDVADTGVTSSSWSYAWVAPTDEALFDSYTFQFWCGDPDGFEGGYPASLQRRVDMVASAPPPLVESEPAAPVIPETD